VNRDRWTVSLGLSQLAGNIEVPTTVVMAGSGIVTLPMVVIFFATERLLTEGLTAAPGRAECLLVPTEPDRAVRPMMQPSVFDGRDE
jgi:hypothetical protein